MPSGGHFVPRRTTRLEPGDGSDFDVIKIAKCLEATKEEIVGIQARFGGKAYDITWVTEEIAAAAASTGIDYAGLHYELRLLGRKNLDVSVFVCCEFPDEYLVELLRSYGDFNESSIRRLKLKEHGYEHIENGVRVVSFRSMDRPLPNSLFYRNTPLGFRYTGQVKLCFKCASPDHTVRDCPNKKPQAPEQTEELDQQQEQTQQQPTQHESDNDSHYETDHHSTSEEDSEQEGDSEMPQVEENKQKKRAKRTRPSSDTDNPSPTKQIAKPQESDITAPKTRIPEIFPEASESSTSATTTNTAPPEQQQKAQENSAPRRKKFLDAIKSPGPARQSLMVALKPAELYYKARGLWLQHQHGDHSAESVRSHRVNNNRDVAEWKKLTGLINQDAFGNLLRLYSEIIEVCDIFPSS